MLLKFKIFIVSRFFIKFATIFCYITISYEDIIIMNINEDIIEKDNIK